MYVNMKLWAISVLAVTVCLMAATVLYRPGYCWAGCKKNMLRMVGSCFTKLRALQRGHFFINRVIIPIRAFVEQRGYSPRMGWFAAQLASWAIKACLAIPLWWWGPDGLALKAFFCVTAIGSAFALAPWLGYRTESIFDIQRRRAEREGSPGRQDIAD